jgi:hypothetical protein
MQITSSLQKHMTSLARPTPKGRPDRGDPLLQKVPHGTPHARHPEQAQGCRACQGGCGLRGVHQSCAAREEGNQLFKEGDFAGAVKSYMESIKREPSDARGYNNRMPKMWKRRSASTPSSVSPTTDPLPSTHVHAQWMHAPQHLGGQLDRNLSCICSTSKIQNCIPQYA